MDRLFGVPLGRLPLPPIPILRGGANRPVPRFRALLLLGLSVANQAACHSWQVPKVTPQEYVTQHPDKKVLVTAKGEHGMWNPEGVVLTEVRFSGDSVSGRDKKGQPVAFGVQQVVAIQVRRVNVTATALLTLAIVGVSLVLFAIAMNSCPGPAC
jgi:hypothetical protein